MANKFHILIEYSLDSKVNCENREPDLYYNICCFLFEDLFNVRIFISVHDNSGLMYCKS